MNLLELFTSSKTPALDENNCVSDLPSLRRRQIRDKVGDLPVFENTKRRLQVAHCNAEKLNHEATRSFNRH